MLILISPAKTLDFDTPPPLKRHTEPRFLEQSEKLVRQMRKLKAPELENIMGVSEKIAQLNVERFKQWKPPFSPDNAKQAIYAFQGDVYQGLDAGNLSADDMKFAQKHLRILSGLYGVLRPLDLIQPYRLEMGTKFHFQGDRTLYDIWKPDVTGSLRNELEKDKNDLVVNLASNEYFKAVDTGSLQARLVTPVFKDEKNGKYKIISFYAKKARGLMASWIIRNKVVDEKALARFKLDGYRYSRDESTDGSPVFLRKEQA